MSKNDVIIALDFSDKKETYNFLEKFDKEIFVKIGMELFYAEGPSIVKDIKAMGHKIFLDLKLHDIPNTVGSAMKVLSKLNVDMCNVHASGTSKMLVEAKKALEGTNTLLIAVTVLTSINQELLNDELMINKNLADAALQLALISKKSGLDGVVCSPLESPIIHENCGKDFLTVTPGIRFAGDSKGDQSRVTTPEKARELGSNYIVVGRSITGAQDPVAAYNKCYKEFVG
ncbi:MAG: orotidine-5'-phosphate decarboxylase [Christensenellaceae bacterium]|nr:orotidine-5'-phosphate decarboxylase [Christensenellaceae bacterium]